VLDRVGFGPTQHIETEDGEPFKFTLNIPEPIDEIRRIIVQPVDPAERYLQWVSADRIDLIREWIQEGMRAEEEGLPKLHDDFPTLLGVKDNT